MWIIWDCEANDWMRELPSTLDDGGKAILSFQTRESAMKRTAKHFGYETYAEVLTCGCGEVVSLGVTCPAPPRRSEVVRKRGA